MFAKLFCCICIIRSGKAHKNKDDQTELLDILSRLLELHERKGWMREVVADTLLLFCSTLTTATSINATLIKLKPLLSAPIPEMAAWQLILSIGLHQQFLLGGGVSAKVAAIWQAEWAKANMSSLPSGSIDVSMNNIDQLTNTLLAATTGFPKVKIPNILIAATVFV